MEAATFGASSELLADETRLVRVRGELDLYTAPELERALEPNGATCGRVVVDLSDCTFIDSSGLRILFNGHRVQPLLIVANRPELLRTFEVSGLDRELTLLPSLKSALNGATP